jgi:VWFA-related protein
MRGFEQPDPQTLRKMFTLRHDPSPHCFDLSGLKPYNPLSDMRRLHLFFFALTLLCSSAFAQQPASPPAPQSPEATPQAADAGQEPPPIIRVEVEEVNIPFIVTDNRNRLITDLTQEDFEVLEDGKPQKIINFSRETDVPLRIGLLVDTSNSIRDRLDFEQRAAADFLRMLLRPGLDKAMLGSFDSMAELLQDFTDDLDQLIAAIQIMRAGGGTALYDAVFYSARDRLMVEAPLNSRFRRALVVLSDGEDNQSRFTRLQTLEMARRAEVIIYTISTNIRGVRTPGDKILEEFSQETGGRFFRPVSWDDLDDAFVAVTDELRSQYIVSFSPDTPRDGRFHEIEIVAKRDNLRVRARRGYFATEPRGSLPQGEAVPAPLD